ncbi:DUF4344 domain-containing metallopeptidase [Rhizobium sp. RAF56]|uniref:DUF4344 domain-containing metallopeptidase n=1 Tax=Rhizobium sp. RAF56 TaxID=3233062 RepID=UPI003F95CE44
MGLRRPLIVMAVLALVCTIFQLDAAEAAKPIPIRIAYVPPKNPEHTALYQELRDKKVLERVRDRLAGLRLPKQLTIKVEGCDGDVNASYDEDEKAVSICYEYLLYIQSLAHGLPPAAVAEGLTPENSVTGLFLEVVLHELSHAIFNLKKVPVLGREEDAADQVTAYLLLQMGEQEAHRTIASIATMFASEAKETKLDFANEHGLPAQRFYNLLCLTYGKDPKMFGDLVAKGLLPQGRAEQCGDEYRQIQFAVSRLMPDLTSSLKLGRPKVR